MLANATDSVDGEFSWLTYRNKALFSPDYCIKTSFQYSFYVSVLEKISLWSSVEEAGCVDIKYGLSCS